MKDEMSDENSTISSERGKNADDPAPFERWLDKKLKTIYGSVLEEPIPQDIIALLQQKLDQKKED